MNKVLTVSRCLPISSTFSSATLSVRAGTISHIVQYNVPLPDYHDESLSAWATYEGVGRPDGPTPAITRIASATSTTMGMLPILAPFPNSSYTLQFYGPALKCQNLSIAILDYNPLIGNGSLEDAWNRTMNPILTSNRNLEILYAAASSVDLTNHLFVVTNRIAVSEVPGNNYSCHYWNTSYTVDFGFNNGLQSANITKLQDIAPLQVELGDLWTSYLPGETQYSVMFAALKNILVAQVGWGSTGSLMGEDSAIVQSGIVACPEVKYGPAAVDYGFSGLFEDYMCRAGSVPGAIEDLSHNLTLSVLGSALLANETSANVTVHAAQNFYAYNWRGLVLAYSIAVLCSAVCVGAGLQALLANGYSAGASFSSILLATRNADLDNLAVGHCLGESPLAKDVKGAVLRYGILKSSRIDECAAGHAAFGFRDDVRDIKRGDACW